MTKTPLIRKLEKKLNSQPKNACTMLGTFIARSSVSRPYLREELLRMCRALPSEAQSDQDLIARLCDEKGDNFAGALSELRVNWVLQKLGFTVCVPKYVSDQSRPDFIIDGVREVEVALYRVHEDMRELGRKLQNEFDGFQEDFTIVVTKVVFHSNGYQLSGVSEAVAKHLNNSCNCSDNTHYVDVKGVAEIFFVARPCKVVKGYIGQAPNCSYGSPDEEKIGKLVRRKKGQHKNPVSLFIVWDEFPPMEPLDLKGFDSKEFESIIIVYPHDTLVRTKIYVAQIKLEGKYKWPRISSMAPGEFIFKDGILIEID